MNKVLEDIKKERKRQKGILLGYAIVSFVLFSIVSYCYFTVIAH
jgi:hypothetical protein